MEKEVVDLIKGLSNKKSAGLDDIPDYIIKKCHLKITTPLTYIINLSLSTGQFPDQLKIAKVKPLYKKRCETEVGNYRPVSLISGFLKIIIKVIKKRLVLFLNNHSIISNTQHGFCKGKSISTATADFKEMVYKSLDEKEISMGIFLNLSKAYDLVNHDILLRRMTREQTVELAYRCIETNEITSSLSRERPIGDPHGSVMGPVLFLIYRLSQEECARLREAVPYGKVYRYNPKHLCPKLNGYRDNGKRSLKL
jgi:hypothetical protein